MKSPSCFGLWGIIFLATSPESCTSIGCVDDALSILTECRACRIVAFRIISVTMIPASLLRKVGLPQLSIIVASLGLGLCFRPGRFDPLALPPLTSKIGVLWFCGLPSSRDERDWLYPDASITFGDDGRVSSVWDSRPWNRLTAERSRPRGYNNPP